MIKYTASSSSPFVRKVSLAVSMKGLNDRIIGVVAEDEPALSKAIRSKNPLYKIPTMMLDDGRVIHDSHVICEYIDSLSPTPRLFPHEIDPRIRTLTLASLSDGIIEAALSIVMEKRFRPADKWVGSWIERQQAKVDAGVDWLEDNIPEIGHLPDYGHLTLAAALGYLDFRFPGSWRTKHPKLVAWLENFSALVPAYAATAPPES